MGLSPDSVVTVYWGADASKPAAADLGRCLKAETPGMHVELIYGGQPNYHYLASVE